MADGDEGVECLEEGSIVITGFRRQRRVADQVMTEVETLAGDG